MTDIIKRIEAATVMLEQSDLEHDVMNSFILALLKDVKPRIARSENLEIITKGERLKAAKEVLDYINTGKLPY